MPTRTVIIGVLVAAIVVLLAAIAFLMGQSAAKQDTPPAPTAQVAATQSAASPTPAPVAAPTSTPQAQPQPAVTGPTLPATAPVAAPTRIGPSFNCAKASTAVERTICAETGLSALDQEVADRYFRAREDPNFGQAHLQEQRAFLAEMRQCGSSDCLYNLYNRRLQELAYYAQ